MGHRSYAHRATTLYVWQMWPQRTRLGSARTTSESSEGRGTIVDVEIISQTGSLRRGYSRADSAYMSNCMSVSSEPFSPGLQVAEEDIDGYVQPRSVQNAERGDILLLLCDRFIYLSYSELYLDYLVTLISNS